MDSRWQADRGTAAAGAILHEQGKLNLEKAFVDATFARAKKGGFAIGPTRRGKGTKIVAIAADNTLPLAITVESASPAECHLVEDALSASLLDELPARLIDELPARLIDDKA